MLTVADWNYYTRMTQESRDELDSLGIRYGKNIFWETFRRNNTWGQCENCGPHHIIRITEILIKSRNDKSVKETILHELLHSCQGGMSHTGKWLRYAKQVNEAYGYNIKRKNSAEEKGLSNLIKYKYKAICNDCGKTYYFNKLNKFVKNHGQGYMCGKCRSQGFTIYDENGNII